MNTDFKSLYPTMFIKYSWVLYKGEKYYLDYYNKYTNQIDLYEARRKNPNYCQHIKIKYDEYSKLERIEEPVFSMNTLALYTGVDLQHCKKDEVVEILDLTEDNVFKYRAKAHGKTKTFVCTPFELEVINL